MSSVEDQEDITKFPLKLRIERVKELLEEYPGRIPVIARIHPVENGRHTVPFLLPKGCTISEFKKVCRKDLNIKPDTAIIVNFSKRILTEHENLTSLYENGSSNDGLLYLDVSKTPAFG